MAEADWDTVYLRKSRPKAGQLKSQQAVNAAQRQGLAVDTQKKSPETTSNHDNLDEKTPSAANHPDTELQSDMDLAPDLIAGLPVAKERKTLPAKLNVPLWKRKLVSVHLSNLPTDLTHDDLVPMFSQFGPVRDCYVAPCTSHFTYGFVRYDTMEAAEQAIAQMDGCRLNGRRINVSLSSQVKQKVDRVKTMSSEQIALEMSNLSEIKSELDRQCEVYNSVYLPAYGTESMEKVDSDNIMQGIATCGYNYDPVCTSHTTRVSLDLGMLDVLLQLDTKTHFEKVIPRSKKSKASKLARNAAPCKRSESPVNSPASVKMTAPKADHTSGVLRPPPYASDVNVPGSRVPASVVMRPPGRVSDGNNGQSAHGQNPVSDQSGTDETISPSGIDRTTGSGSGCFGLSQSIGRGQRLRLLMENSRH